MHMSKAAGNGLWYLDASLFEDADRHQEFVLNLKYEFERSTEPFAKKYIENHPNWQGDSFKGDNPDAWCSAVSGGKSIQEKVKALFEASSQIIPIHKIGIPTNWKYEPLWR